MGPFHHARVDVGCRNDHVGAVGVHLEFIDPLLEVEASDHVARFMDAVQGHSLPGADAGELKDLADVSSGTHGRHFAILFFDFIPYPPLHLFPDSRGVVVFQYSHRTDLEGSRFDFLSASVEVKLCASTAHIDMQVSLVRQK